MQEDENMVEPAKGKWDKMYENAGKKVEKAMGNKAPEKRDSKKKKEKKPGNTSKTMKLLQKSFC